MNDDSHNPHRSLTIRDAALGVALASFAAGVLIAVIALLGTTTTANAQSGSVSYGGGGVGSGDGGGDTSSDGVFPVDGRHTYGDGFGAGRGHQGQDIFAACGTRLVAAIRGRVQQKGNDRGGGGNYVVIDVAGTQKDHVYMHLARPARVDKGDRVGTGRLIGKVGDTGNAVGCHLHFELWSAPGYYQGGRPLSSVTKFLRALDRKS